VGYKILRTAPEMKFKRGFPEKQIKEGTFDTDSYLSLGGCRSWAVVCDSPSFIEPLKSPRSTATQREIRVSVKRALLDDPDGA
jgi:hypothetical protein